jgi:hypothetical protein
MVKPPNRCAISIYTHTVLSTLTFDPYLGCMAIFSIKMSTKDWVDPNQQRRKGLDEEIIGLEFKQVSLLCEWSVEWSVWWVQWHPNSLLGRRYLGQQVIICQKLLSTCYRVDMFFNIFTQTEFVVHIQRTKHVEMVKTHQSAALPVYCTSVLRVNQRMGWHMMAPNSLLGPCFHGQQVTNCQKLARVQHEVDVFSVQLHSNRTGSWHKGVIQYAVIVEQTW